MGVAGTSSLSPTPHVGHFTPSSRLPSSSSQCNGGSVTALAKGSHDLHIHILQVQHTLSSVAATTPYTGGPSPWLGNADAAPSQQTGVSQPSLGAAHTYGLPNR